MTVNVGRVVLRIVGFLVEGSPVGNCETGSLEGSIEGELVGVLVVGAKVGFGDGSRVGFLVLTKDGCTVEVYVGSTLGIFDGFLVIGVLVVGFAVVGPAVV